MFISRFSAPRYTHRAGMHMDHSINPKRPISIEKSRPIWPDLPWKALLNRTTTIIKWMSASHRKQTPTCLRWTSMFDWKNGRRHTFGKWLCPITNGRHLILTRCVGTISNGRRLPLTGWQRPISNGRRLPTSKNVGIRRPIQIGRRL